MSQDMYATAIMCMDGAFTRPVQKNTKSRWGRRFIDVISQPGIVKVLAEKTNQPRLELIKEMLEISVVNHQSRAIVIAAHHNCLGNPVSKEKQLQQLPLAQKTVEKMLEQLELGHFNIDITLLWINHHHLPEEVCISGTCIETRELVFAQ